MSGSATPACWRAWRVLQIEQLHGWQQPSGDECTLGLTHNTTASAERRAAAMPHTAYAIDDETAITVVDGATEVVSEGQWRVFNVE